MRKFLFILIVSLILFPLFMIEAVVSPEVTQQHLVLWTIEEATVESADPAEVFASNLWEADMNILSCWMNDSLFDYKAYHEYAGAEGALLTERKSYPGGLEALYNDAGGGILVFYF